MMTTTCLMGVALTIALGAVLRWLLAEETEPVACAAAAALAAASSTITPVKNRLLMPADGTLISRYRCQRAPHWAARWLALLRDDRRRERMALGDERVNERSRVEHGKHRSCQGWTADQAHVIELPRQPSWQAEGLGDLDDTIVEPLQVRHQGRGRKALADMVLMMPVVEALENSPLVRLRSVQEEMSFGAKEPLQVG